MTQDRIVMPPFKALMAFWAAATHDRLADAAVRIGVTESAISHQLKNLETTLNVQLFDRGSGRLELTAEGRRYLDRIDPALKEIQAATAALMPPPGRQAVRLTLPPSLAATWLIPRLGAFETAAPDLDVQLVLTTRLIDLARDRIDLAIRYGRGAWDGVAAQFLFEDLATPVAAPGLLPPEIGPEAVPDDIRFIVNRAIPAEWEEWARARSIAAPPPERMVTLDSIEQVLQVAEAGHGIAMGRSPYIQAPLAEGRLVAPFGSVGPTGAAYYLCTPERITQTAAARRLARWLAGEAASVAPMPPTS
ncbi:MAG: LysR substrate-binding domain-containing protein [Pseudomonadota bacterium]